MSKVDLALQEKYDGYYSGQSDWRAMGAKDKVDNIVALCRGISQGTILDVGAGEGSLLERLSTIGFGEKYWAAEISESGIATIEGRNIENLAEVRKFDGYSLPYGDREFDLCIASHVLEHVEHERLFLREIARVARHVFIEVPLEDTWRLRQDVIDNDIGHINFYNPASVRRLVESCGLEVIEQRLFDVSLPTMTFHNRPLGLVKYVIRRSAFIISPTLASKVFTYRCCLLCRRNRGNTAPHLG